MEYTKIDCNAVEVMLKLEKWHVWILLIALWRVYENVRNEEGTRKVLARGI